MNDKELKDFQERERQEKERQAKEEREKKEREDKERYEKMEDKHKRETAERAREKEREKKQLAKAHKPRSAEAKAREKMRKTPEHQAMREAIREQVAERQQTAKEGVQGTNTVRNSEQQAEANKYAQMHQNDAKAALGTVGKAHGEPQVQGLNGVQGFEEQQATAALRAQGEARPWKQAQQAQQHNDQAKTNEHGKGRDDPDHVKQGNGPDRPGPAPAPAHAHHGHGHMPWDKNPHQAKAGLSKDVGQDLGHGQGKPWEHRADPDQAESRMAQQAREKEQERGR